jgi:broad specificity phosphatase PhoE
MMLSAFLLVSVLLGGNHHTEAGPTTVILVRHAERQDASENPPLSAAGHGRAKELARVLSGTRLSRIYTTPFLRTNQTAEPVATAQKLKPVVFLPGKTYAADLAAKIRADDAGETILVVGHSNTTQQLLRALGIAQPPPIADPQYDDLFICTMGADGKVSLVSLRYGATAR